MIVHYSIGILQITFINIYLLAKLSLTCLLMHLLLISDEAVDAEKNINGYTTFQSHFRETYQAAKLLYSA